MFTKVIWFASSINVGTLLAFVHLFLPPYSPQMNRIEDEWLHLKRDQQDGQVFEDEYELAIALIEDINHRAKQGQYQVDRFMFN